MGGNTPLDGFILDRSLCMFIFTVPSSSCECFKNILEFIGFLDSLNALAKKKVGVERHKEEYWVVFD